jgi:hypothetical protein
LENCVKKICHNYPIKKWGTRSEKGQQKAIPEQQEVVFLSEIDDTNVDKRYTTVFQKVERWSIARRYGRRIGEENDSCATSGRPQAANKREDVYFEVEHGGDDRVSIRRSRSERIPRGEIANRAQARIVWNEVREAGESNVIGTDASTYPYLRKHGEFCVIQDREKNDQGLHHQVSDDEEKTSDVGPQRNCEYR